MGEHWRGRVICNMASKIKLLKVLIFVLLQVVVVYLLMGVYQIPAEYQQEQCKAGPAKNVLYMKIYKTGSTTLQNIFYRYAWNNNLTIVPVFNDPRRFELSNHLVPKKYRKKHYNNHYNIFPEHIKKFNKSDYSTLMPNNTIYIASVRHPMTQFMSLLKEYHFIQGRLGLESADPLDQAEEILSSKSGKLLDPLLGAPDLLYNQMATQFNLMTPSGHAKDNMDSVLDEADDIFSLVLLTERFDEGLVLMRRKLCWDQKDIIYVHLRHRPRAFDDTSLDGYVKEHKKRSAVDYVLYERFKAKMETTIKMQSADFHDELANFKRRIKQIGNYCGEVYNTFKTTKSIVHSSKPRLDFDDNQWTSGFSIDPYKCLLMKTENHVFRNKLLFRQMPINICQSLVANQIPVASNLVLKRNRLHCSEYYCDEQDEVKSFKELFSGNLRHETLLSVK